jgi:molybdate transport system ATP-binding protein
LDEPLAALDASTRDEIRRDLRAHLSAFDGVRIVVTHDPVDAAVLADRVVVLEAGRVVQIATPAELAARPRHRWVADLAGTNLFSGVATGTTIAVTGGGELHAGAATRGAVFVAVQPRAVSLHPRRPDGSARNAWRGQVRTIEPVGDRVRVFVDGVPPITGEVTVGAVRDLALTEGAEVWVAVKATELDVYPA